MMHPWLEKAPSNWEVVRLRATVDQCINGFWGDEPDGENDILCIRVADFDRRKRRVAVEQPTYRAIPLSKRGKRLLHNGDLLIEKSGGGEQQPVGTVVLYDSSEPAVCSNFIGRIAVSKKYSSRYMNYVHESLYSLGITARSIKQTTGIQNLDTESYFNEKIAAPDLLTQEIIADFLDSKTAIIDALIAKKERFIELLAEKRQSIIVHAVTKGLIQKVPLKDSEVEWIGQIPAHWTFKKLKFLVRAISGGTPSKDEARFWNGTVPWVSPKDMKVHVIADSEDHVSEVVISERLLKMIAPPAVLIVVRGMILAKAVPVAVTARPLTINQDMKALIPEHEVSSHFLAYLLRGIEVALLSLIEEAGHGTRKLRSDYLFASKIPVPPSPEQLEITEYLERETTNINRLVEKIAVQIEQLRLYRESLIGAAVMGQIEIAPTQEAA
jgi:type I restriction enzyme S subunit